MAMFIAGFAACMNISVANIDPPADHKPVTNVPTDRDAIYKLKVKGVD